VGELARQQHDWTGAVAYHTEGLRLWRLLDDKHGLASALRFLGLVAPLLPERRRLIGEAMALYQEVGDTYGVAISCMNLGRNILGHGDDPAEATALLEQGLTLFRELRETTGLAWTLMGLGEAAACQGHFAHASTCFAESLSLFRELGDRRRIAWVLNSLACALVNAGEVARVEPILQESLSICQELPNRLDLRGTVGEWAHLAVRQGQVTRAARLLGAAERLIEPRSAPLASLPNSWERLVEEIRAQLDAATFAAAWAEGQAMTLEQAIAYALEDDTTAD
jgi:tetratricopeptide (TPR) repeat protein